MPTEALVLLLISFVVTFVAARVLGRGWRQRRREKLEQAKRANESRQVRRARERRQGK